MYRYIIFFFVNFCVSTFRLNVLLSANSPLLSFPVNSDSLFTVHPNLTIYYLAKFTNEGRRIDTGIYADGDIFIFEYKFSTSEIII